MPEELRIEINYEAEYEAYLKWKEREESDDKDIEENQRGILIIQM